MKQLLRRQAPVPFESPLPPALRWLPTGIAVLIVSIPAFVTFQHGAALASNVLTILIAVVLVVALLLRQRLPRSMSAVVSGVVCVVVVLTALDVLGPGPLVSGVLCVMVTLFGVGTRLGRDAALLMLAIAVVSIGSVLLIAHPSESRGLESLVMLVALVGLAASAGIAQHNGRAYIASITERARRAEETRESEAERRVAEERLAIARDLHDVMAHQIAVINLHAASASQALRQRPDDAERSLATVREAARTVLGEIAGLLSVLRSGDAHAVEGSNSRSPSLSPAPGLAHLPGLVADFERAGLRVEQRTTGTPVELDSPRDIAAYRLVQEALTNAHKHGADGSALLQFDFGSDDEVTVSVTNVTRAESDDRIVVAGGHGLVGARERVGAVGGHLETSFGPGPVHRFVAHLPAVENRS
ncbi:sensor histidine kinase [Agreia sp. COWG]|uniref:sensor histidine kinase n=1 Tax=Agreia sp. COWG TaxID=2773266 RepID=UPI001928B155|nr:histidine kinase [Agreia sp. COWG]CAD6001039.1 HisKA_3 domain-containing protein [Agreia sp. COWG]